MDPRPADSLSLAARRYFWPCKDYGAVAMCAAVTPVMPGCAAVLLGLRGTGPGGTWLVPSFPAGLLVGAGVAFLLFAFIAIVMVGGAAARFRAGDPTALPSLRRWLLLVTGSAIPAVALAPDPVVAGVFAFFGIAMIPLLRLFARRATPLETGALGSVDQDDPLVRE